MTTLTDKELIKEIKERIGSLDVRDNIERRAYEIALASLEAEPIGFRCRRNDNLGDWSYVYHREPDDFERKHLVIEGIYASPPAPVVPEEKPMPNPLSMYAVDAVAAIAEVRGWNACRAAMLHSAEPASNHEELPLDYLQGQKDGLEWAAQLAEANHPQTGDWLYDDPLELAKAIRKGPDMPEFDGPTPVTPDSWISCSDRMPEDTKMLLAFSQGQIVAAYWNWVMSPIDYKKYRAFTYLSGNILDDVTHWMPLPEPPQEADNG
ncbi:TPA: DUF551 domain-containing protein [Escherichia coli]|uniref:DUF551 domain-containing protein n=3 Tax=Escherichia coli TaxID=562 RepID=UPI0019A1CEDA|nr:DUF551 domain-containing protein [Escherichia coli]HAL3846824.1 DUF551 domain-containing protein [Escherichia coli]HAM7218522.1 DUF551 domain-containing protein [Escherichia coli]HBD2142578.1 DUF551 domain-containing protein [Escherichia coli]HEK5358372.1 DUF551 domain-containing protein [Escherichia coli]HEK7389579.1 DUF551 domain-containing protein [Escherichia coli]